MPSGIPSVHELAALARLEIPSSDEARYTKDFEDILGYVGQIERVRAELPPLTSTITGVRHVLREDRPGSSDLAAKLLGCAPESRGGLVRVPPVL